jgi:TrmH family RNA methyltransferase
MELITSFSNSIIKQARALRKRKVRAETGLFLVEGIHHVSEAVEAGWQIENILYAPELLTSYFARGLLDRVKRFSIQPQPVSARVMESIADKENPQGVLAIVRQKQTDLDSLTSIRSAAALVSPQDPGNVGAILRTLDAVNANALFLLDPHTGQGSGVDPYHPTAVRASMGAIFWKPIVQAAFNDFVEWARHGGYQLIGSSAHAQVAFYTLVPRIPWILVLGNEQKGLTAEQIAACDVSVSLPMHGRISSLNLAVAAGVLMYQYFNREN